ncbi:hypothetical protein OJF2_33280 [Aquisphaera giovannonii]|uniref:Uncharacterized protein n=1 Tax=Aquisphaera giovannonii TaxID=406548 RepID=A0A5B9W2I2_9BACT|nr:hypothetical protein [Aquisphaera giovannonii]QEH34786.1 hypothetical protein OJF2_33280 [Aquisphaera giovannonii]
MSFAITRRAFLTASSVAVSGVAIPHRVAQADARPLPAGPVYGRVGERGIRPGREGRPSLGEAELLDGRRLLVRHEAAHAIGAGKSVLLAPSADGVFSILYAEV